MDARALAAAHRAANRAFEAAKRLQDAETLDEQIDAWEDHLMHAARVYEKLKAGARGNQKSWAWFGKKQDERNDDELLCYMHHARNADYHRLEDVTHKEPGPRFAGKMRGERIDVEIPGKLKLVPVTDKQIEYQPPKMFKGRGLQNDYAYFAAFLMVIHLREMVAEAHSLRR
jgi:hypothetical protein